MNPRERYTAFMRWQSVDRPPLLEWAPWETTIERWMRESGQPREEVLGYLREADLECNAIVDFGLRPPVQERTLSEDDASRVRVDPMGLVYREYKQGRETSMPEFIQFPVRDAGDWAKLKPRFDPTDPDRYPADWSGQVAHWRREGAIVRLFGASNSYSWGPSLYGFARTMLGDEQVLYAFYDQPALVHDMMETVTDFCIVALERALREAPVTWVQFWEDMCYKGGPLISPALFRTFMLPRYQRLIEALRRAGAELILVDSDGDVSQLVPLWLEAGMDGVYPMEQAAGNDLHAYRKRYGKDLLMTGGIDKRALAWGKAAIDRELETKIPLALEGGYIPTVDHAIPPDVSYDHFCYYWERKQRLLGV